MGENSKIEWCDHTWNPWEGCQKVGPGCDHCYAEARNARFGRGTAPNWGPGAPRRRTSEANWRKPLAWNREAQNRGRRFRVFCASLADVFDNEVHPDWRSDLFELIHRTPHLDWLLLTKRIGNVQRMLWDDAELRAMPANVWLGATIVNQEEADRDIPKLLAIDARVRFLSMEPLLGPVDLRRIVLRGDGQLPTELSTRLGDYVQPLSGNFRDSPKIDWVIVGGESGKDARPMHPDWARSVRDQCARVGVPFLFKQWGEWGPFEAKRYGEYGRWLKFDMAGKSTTTWPDGTIGPGSADVSGGLGSHLVKFGKKETGRMLDGVTHDGMPA